MDDQERGFLNDTSLSKAPKSPLKTSTLMKQPGKSTDAHLRQNAADDSLFSVPFDSTKALHEVTNVPNIPKPRFNFTLESSRNDSSLGILQMDRFSDFTDTSMQAMVFSKTPVKQKSKKLKPFISKKNLPPSKENLSLNSTWNSVPDIKDSEREFSDSDIEYDGINIPELNMEYDGLPTSLISNPCNSFGSQPSASCRVTSGIQSKNNLVCSEYTSSIKDETSSNEDKFENTRGSIFKSYEPPSLLDTLLLKDSERKMSENWKRLGLDSSKAETLLQDESANEKKFLQSLQNFNSLSNSPLKFCVDEISARSSSFRSPSTSVNDSTNRVTPKNECMKSLNNEGLKDGRSSRSQFPETIGKPTKLSDTYTTYEAKTLESKNHSERSFDCELNYKNTSVFFSEGGEKSFEQFQVSDSDFLDPGDALKLIQQDEESYMKEHMFEMMDNSKESVAESNYSLQQPGDVTAPSWFLEEYNTSKFSQERISVGTLFRARTENLGRLSEDSKRERPYFGMEAKTPMREQDSALRSDLSEAKSPESSKGNSTLKSELSQSLQNNETEILRGSYLSQFLNDTSTANPLDLAQKIIDMCKIKDQNSLPIKKSNASTIKHLSLEDIHEESMNSSSKTTSTLTRSSSMNNLERVLSKSSKEESVNNTLSVSNVELNNHKMEENAALARGCVNCLGQVPRVSGPPSCASYAMSAHNSCPSLHGCMSHCSQPQPHGFPMCSFPSHAGCSHGLQYHSPFVQEMSFPLQNQPGAPVGTYSSLPFSASGGILIQGPSQLVYPEKIAIGDAQQLNLTVQNCCNRGCLYNIALTSAMINDKPVPVEISGVHVPHVVPNDAGNTTDIQVSLSPKYEGKSVVTVQVVACFNHAQPMSTSVQNSFQTTIYYEALRPVIDITHLSKDSLDIGTTVAGSTVTKLITILNKCDASVPLYISLSNDVKNNRILFDLNQMKSQKLADSEWLILSPKDILYRIPSARNGTIGCTLDVPVIIETGSEDSDVDFVLSAAIQSFKIKEILAIFRISASVRVAKLTVVDSSQTTLILKPDSSKQKLRVKNSASVSMIYNLVIINDDTGSFSVSPSSLDLQPMQTSVVTLSFNHCNKVVECSLQAAAQPHGKLFPLIGIVGDVQSSIDQCERPARNQTSQGHSSRTSDVLQCNRRHLFWKGINVGSTLNKTFTVKNCSNSTLLFKIYIKDKSKGFKLLTEDNQQTFALSVELASMEEREFLVTFAPTSVTSTSAILFMKAMDAQQKVFSLPLVGYSGSGHLEVKGLTSKRGIGDCLDIFVETESKSSSSNVILQNTGEREIFVKVVISLGRAFEIDGHMHVNPTELVLLKNESKILFISSTVPDQLYAYNETDWGTITLLFGDEILRQQMRRSRNRNSSSPWNNLFEGINFDVPFEGEDRVPCDSFLHSASKLQSLFTSAVKKFQIHLNIVKTNNTSQRSFNALSVIDDTFANLTCDSTILSHRRVTLASHSPPVKDHIANPPIRLSVPVIKSAELLEHEVSVFKKPDIPRRKIPSSWTVKPESLTIDTNGKDNNRVLLINSSNQDLKFKIECEIHVVSVSPVSGIIPAKGQIGLRISVITYSVGKLLEDYQGHIKVFCDNNEKSILIKVPKCSKKQDNTVLEAITNAAGKPKSLGASVEKIASSSVTVQNICNFPQEITLNDPVLEKTSETIATVKNSENMSANWGIQPISTCSFFESISETEAYGDQSRSTVTPDVKELDPKLKKSESAICIDNEICEFPATAFGKLSVQFVTIKNRSSQDMKIFLKEPLPPFYMKTLEFTVRNKSFVKIPIAFKPKPSDPCKRILELQSGDGNKFFVKMIGICM